MQRLMNLDWDLFFAGHHEKKKHANADIKLWTTKPSYFYVLFVGPKAMLYMEIPVYTDKK